MAATIIAAPIIQEPNRHLLLCDCGDGEHIAIWSYWPDAHEADDVLYLQYHLSLDRPWYRRVGSAIRHVTGHRSRYGDFGEIVLTTNIARSLWQFLGEYLDDH